MVEDDLFQEFEVSKVELVEDYCAGELGLSKASWVGGCLLGIDDLNA